MPANAQSWIDVNWMSPVNYAHPLFRGRDAVVGFWLNVPHWQGGTVWRDLTGRNHGTLTNMAPASDWVRGNRLGGWGALDFDGDDDHIVIGGLSSLAADLTISIWFNSSTGDSPHRIFDLAEAAAVGMQLRFGAAGVARVTEGGAPELLSANAMNDGVDHQAVVTRKGTTFTLYVDGVQEASDTGTVNTFTRLYLAQRSDLQAGRFYPGLLDRVIVHSRALTSNEVLQDYLLSRLGNQGLLNRIESRLSVEAAVVAAGAGIRNPFGGPMVLRNPLGA